MLNYRFTCCNCHITFLITENSIVHSTSLTCPHCNAKFSASEMNHLKNDIEYRKKHSNFHVSITDSPDIDLEKINSFASDAAMDGLDILFQKRTGKPDCYDDIKSFVSENEPVLLYNNLYSMHLLKAYHYQLANILQEHGISIGELKRPIKKDDPSAP